MMPKPQPSANTSGSLALGPRHQYFLKAPKGFYHLARYGIHWAKVSQWGHWASTCQLKYQGQSAPKWVWENNREKKKLPIFKRKKNDLTWKF